MQDVFGFDDYITLSSLGVQVVPVQRIGTPFGKMKSAVATNRLSLTGFQVRELYSTRQAVEEVFRFLKSELGLQFCQTGYTRIYSATNPPPTEGSQAHHIALCLVAYLILERERVQ